MMDTTERDRALDRPAPGAWRKGWLGWLKRLIHKDCDRIHRETLEVLRDQVRYGNDRHLRLTAEVIHKDAEIARLTAERDALLMTLNTLY